MNVSNQLQEIAVFLAQNRFAAVLEKVTVPVMTPVVPDGVARQQPEHHRDNGNSARSQQEMKMVGHQRPDKTCRFHLFQDRPRMFQEITAVLIILENFTLLYASYNKVLQRTRPVNAGLSVHAKEDMKKKQGL